MTQASAKSPLGTLGSQATWVLEIPSDHVIEKLSASPICSQQTWDRESVHERRTVGHGCDAKVDLEGFFRKHFTETITTTTTPSAEANFCRPTEADILHTESANQV